MEIKSLIKSKEVRIIYNILLAIFMIFLIRMAYKTEHPPCPSEREIEIIKPKYYNGVVNKKYLDYKNKGLISIEITDLKDSIIRIAYLHHRGLIMHEIQIGDSIYKAENSFDIKVIKSNSQIKVYKYSCEDPY